MIRGIYLTYNDDLNDIHSIRKAVFTDELGIPADLEADDNDMMAMHALLQGEDGSYVATARMRFDGETYILDKVAVLPDRRRQGYADFVVRMLLDKVFTAEGKVIYADVLNDSRPFFESIGFKENGALRRENAMNVQPMILNKENVKTKCGGHH